MGLPRGYLVTHCSALLAIYSAPSRFHVDDLSSAHVYLRLPPGVTMDKIPAAVLEDCSQLVKANSIQGEWTHHLLCA